ncbi:hypothetical protein BH11ARM1_BH11ARM1_13690 [soil metagenome]
METASKRIRDRADDFFDWIDYRSDPHWWPYLLTAFLVAIVMLIAPLPLMLISLDIALVATAGLIAFAAAGLIGYGLVIGVSEYVKQQKARTHHGPLVIHRNHF